MANRLTTKRRKCVKSPNIFRDKQEYSSLYTISSRSASSLHSSDMASQIGKQSNQIRMYKGQHQKGDAATPTTAKPQPCGKYPKLPTEISQELQQKVYSNCYKNYYVDRAEFIKNKFDSLTLENTQQCAKPYCPVYNAPPKRYVQQNRRCNVQSPENHRYVVNSLEESYWAKWKPNKCDDMETWQSYLTQQASCKRMQRCCPPPSPPIMRECTPLTPLKPQMKKMLKSRCCEEKRLKIIREPKEMRDSNSSEAVLSQKGEGNKSKCSCCSCDDDSDTKSSKSTKSVNDDDDKRVQFRQRHSIEDYESEELHIDTSQEEYENLYNEVYMEYENDLSNKISEYEMQMEAEEMREMEIHLAEQEMRNQAKEMERRLEEQETRRLAEEKERQLKESEIRKQAEEREKYLLEQEMRKQAEKKERDLEELEMRKQAEEKERRLVEQDMRKQAEEKERDLAQRVMPYRAEGKERDLEQRVMPNQAEENEQRLTEQEMQNQTTQEIDMNTETEINVVDLQVHEIEDSQSREVAARVARQSENKGEANEIKILQSQEMLNRAIQENEMKLSEEWEPRRPKVPLHRDGTMRLRMGELSFIDEDSGLLESASLELQQPETVSRTNSEATQKKNSSENGLLVTNSNEYSEPEIAILKHTDSFIITSRRQKEDRPRKPQPKFLKLTNKVMFAGSPSAKGHTYPLKSAMKKEKSSPPIVGYGRSVSPVSTKMRSTTRQFQPSYLFRH